MNTCFKSVICQSIKFVNKKGPQFHILQQLRTMYSIKLADGRMNRDDLLRLLSPRTHSLTLHEIDFNERAGVTLADVLQQAPNVSTLNLFRSVDSQDSWLEDLLKYKSEEMFSKLSNLSMTVRNTDFDVEMFAKFMETKCSKGAQISISFAMVTFDDMLMSTHIDRFQAHKPELLKFFDQFTITHKEDEKSDAFIRVYLLNGVEIDEEAAKKYTNQAKVNFSCVVSCGTGVTESCGDYILKNKQIT